jgi:isopenicillin N synthase-like dioxygenase
VKQRYHRAGARGQRGYTGFGTEHARDSKSPDLKEFWQIGRTDVPDEHPVHAPFGANLWPDEVVPEFRPTMTALYQALDQLGAVLLEACAVYIDEPAGRFREMAEGSDTIVRVIYYPPVGAGAPQGSVRSAAHEDINLITLLSGATSEGLELLRRDGTWMPVHTGLDTIVVDSGDMLQNVTNGLYRSTTHRVVNPADATSDRYSMPCFIHPRKEVDLTPLPSCVARTGGEARYPSISAGDYLIQRLREIGLG